MGKYWDEAEEDAKSWILDRLLPDIVDLIIDYRGVTDRLLHNDYVYHSESHQDRWYDFDEAAEILDDLSDYEERDTGLWAGADGFREMAQRCAAYTYGNAVMAFARQMLETINSDAVYIAGEEEANVAEEVEHYKDTADALTEHQQDSLLREFVEERVRSLLA